LGLSGYVNFFGEQPINFSNTQFNYTQWTIQAVPASAGLLLFASGVLAGFFRSRGRAAAE
jgi:hypothetical protein